MVEQEWLLNRPQAALLLDVGSRSEKNECWGGVIRGNPPPQRWRSTSSNSELRPLHTHAIPCLNLSMFKMTHPILGTRDIQRAIEFYTQRLGFRLAFGDKTNPPNYVGFRRDAVELHMQFQFEHEMGTIRLRFLVEDPDALFNEYRERGVQCSASGIRDTPWGTREFALYDLDRNALTFYRDLSSAEKEHPPAA